MESMVKIHVVHEPKEEALILFEYQQGHFIEVKGTVGA